MNLVTVTTEVEQLQRHAADMRIEACKHDNMDPKLPFIVFTPDNPYLEEYDQAMARIQYLKRK